MQIVCGAPNARPGLKAPLAMVGANLPGGIAIKAAKLRGVESSGMLCSAKELGVDADASGLLELPDDAPVGQPLAEYLGLPDASIEIKLTPNRADCFSVRGIAYDVAAALGSEVRAFDAAPVAAQSDATLAVELQAGARVPRFVGRVIDKRRRHGADAGVDGRAPAPQRRASDQLPRRRHPVRDARTRPADARLRQGRRWKAPSSCVRRARAKNSSCSTAALSRSTRSSSSSPTAAAAMARAPSRWAASWAASIPA